MLVKDNGRLGVGICLYSNSNDPYSHRVRFALKIKNISAEIIEVKNPAKPPQDLCDINPYHKNYAVPTLMERQLVLYHPDIIMQYLNNRFPTPPFLPSDPGDLAKYNIQVWRLTEDIISLSDSILSGKNRYKSLEFGKELRSQLVSFSYYNEQRFNISNSEEQRTPDMIDCMLAPILWRLSVMGIELSDNLKHKKLRAYSQWLFSQPAFMKSCSPEELAYHQN